MRSLSVLFLASLLTAACGAGAPDDLEPDDGKADLADTRGKFESFTLRTGGFCPAGVACGSVIELLGDGTLRVGYQNSQHATMLTQISDEDEERALKVFNAPALIKLLKNGPRNCVEPQDRVESMVLVREGVSLDASTLGCAQGTIVAARQLAEELAATYLPRPTFDSFAVRTGGFCPPNVACGRSISFLATGRLRVIQGAAEPVDAQLSPVDAGRAVVVLGAAALRALIETPDLGCTQPQDRFETMLFTVDDEEIATDTIGCRQPEIVAARELLNELADAYLAR